MNIERIFEIQKWLKLTDKRMKCPFHFRQYSWKICLELFPEMENKSWDDGTQQLCGSHFRCPCYVYEVEEVISVAKEVING
jgi:hypothetical protein